MKILIIFFHGNLFQPKAGHEVRIYNLVKSLAKNHEVITLESANYLSTPKTLPVAKRCFFNDLKLKGTGFGRTFANFNFYYLDKLNKIINIEKPDIIQVEYPYGLFPVKFFTRIRNSNSIIIYDAHDVELERLRNLISKEKFYSMNFIKSLVSYLYCLIFERFSCKIVDHILCVSKYDKKLFCKLYSLEPTKITVIPSGAVIPDLSKFDKFECRRKLGLPEDKVIIVFHGSYLYPPNMDAIKLIENYIAPNILKKYKDATFAIAGKDCPKYEKDNIKFIGFVDDLHELLCACDIAICPILRGGGTRLKIMDYMSASLPLVSTKKGIEGIEAENNKHAIIVDGVNKDFVDAISYLIENENERKRFGKNARKLVEDKYDWKKIGEKLNMLYNKLWGHNNDFYL